MIRPEDGGDHDAVRQVVRAAFTAHADHVAGLVDGLRDLGGLSLVAEVAGSVVGHVMLTPGLLDARSGLVEVQVLSPLSVRPDHQQRGLGGELVRAALVTAGEAGAPAVFLEGSPRYYPRFGFEPGAPLGFRKPSLRIPDAAFQVAC